MELSFSNIKSSLAKATQAPRHLLNAHAGGCNPANYNKNPLQVAADAYRPTIDSAKAKGCELMNSVFDAVTLSDEAKMELHDKGCKGIRAKSF